MRSGGGNNEGAGGQAGLKKGPWTPAEDMILMEYVRNHGEGNWNAVQKNSVLSRCGKSCRLRWANHLRPNLKKGAFSPEEELLILRLHAQLGNKWARMAAHLPGRTDNEIKNYWNTRIKRRQRAGLPLYPSDIQRQAAAAHGAQTHHMSPATPPPLSPASPPTTTHFTTTPFSLLDPTGLSSQFSRHHHHLPMSNSVTELPRIKRLRDYHNYTHLGFQLSFASSHPPPLYQPQPQHAFQYNPGSFDLSGPFAPQPRFPMKLELPSTQLFPESSGSHGGGLLDAMLQETTTTDTAAGRDGLLSSTDDHQDTKWVHLVTGNRDNVADGESAQGETEESAEKCNNQEHATEKKMIKNESAHENNNPMSEELSALLDMIPATTTTEWCNGDSGGPSSVITDEDMGLDMQQLATSMSMGHEGQEWNLESCPWSPGICRNISAKFYT